MDEHFRLAAIDFPRSASVRSSVMDESVAKRTPLASSSSLSSPFTTAVIPPPSQSSRDGPVTITAASSSSLFSTSFSSSSTSTPPRRGSFSAVDSHLHHQQQQQQIASGSTAPFVAAGNENPPSSSFSLQQVSGANDNVDDYSNVRQTTATAARRNSRVDSNGSSSSNSSSANKIINNNNNSSQLIGSQAISVAADTTRNRRHHHQNRHDVEDSSDGGATKSPRGFFDRILTTTKDDIVATTTASTTRPSASSLSATTTTSFQQHNNRSNSSNSNNNQAQSSSFVAAPSESSLRSSSSLLVEPNHSSSTMAPPVLATTAANSATSATVAQKSSALQTAQHPVASLTPLSVSRRSSQSSSANENVSSTTATSHPQQQHKASSRYQQQHSSHGHVAAAAMSSSSNNTLPSQQQQSSSGNVQQLNQLQTEISIKDELLKHQTFQLVETHRRQADLEEQLAFFKIDAKFDSVANILLKNRFDADQLFASTANSDFTSVSPLPPAPYIGKSPFKLILGNTLNEGTSSGNNNNSTSRRSSMLNPRDSFLLETASSSPRQKATTSSKQAADEALFAATEIVERSPLIVGLPRELSSSLRKLSEEIGRVCSECANLRRHSDKVASTSGSNSGSNNNGDQLLQKALVNLEHSADRLDDDIGICQSRLEKLRADVPSQLTGSNSINSIFDSLSLTLDAARHELTLACRLKDEALNNSSTSTTASTPSHSPSNHNHNHNNNALHSKPPPYGRQSGLGGGGGHTSNNNGNTSNEIHSSTIKLGPNEPSPLFMAALADMSGQTPAGSTALLPFEQLGGDNDSNNKTSRPNGSHRFLQDQHRFQTRNNNNKSESGATTSNTDDETTAEYFTQQLLSRLRNSEQMAVQYKTDVDNMKARLDSFTPINGATSNSQMDPSSVIGGGAIQRSSSKLDVSADEAGVVPLTASTPKPAEKGVDATFTVVGAENVTVPTKQRSSSPTTPNLASKQLGGGSGFASSSSVEAPPHVMCAASFDVAASAFKNQLSGLNRRLDTHETFVLNAFGSMLDKYIIQQPTTSQQPALPQPPVPPTTVVIEKRVVNGSTKARGTQVSASDDEEHEIEAERSRHHKKRLSTTMKHSATDSNLRLQKASSSTELVPNNNEPNKNFEQILTQFKTDMQDMKQTFLQTVQQQQQQQAQQMSELQKEIHQQQQQKRASTPPPSPPQHERSRSRRHHQSSHRHSSPRSTITAVHHDVGVSNEMISSAFSGRLAALEETLATLSQNRQLLTEQVNQLEVKRMSLEEEVSRLTVDCQQLAVARDQIRENAGQYESQIQLLAGDLANKQHELAIIDEMIADGRRVLADLNTKTGDLQTKFELLQSTAEQHRIALETVVCRTSIAKEELGTLEQKLAQSKHEIGSAEKSLSERQRELQAVNEAIRVAKADWEMISRERQDFLEDSSYVMSEHSALRNSISTLANERDNLLAQIESAREGLLVLEARSLTKQQECDTTQRGYEDLIGTLTTLKVRRDSLQHEIESSEKRLLQMQTVADETNDRRRALRNEVDSLQLTKADLITEIESLKVSMVGLRSSSSSMNMDPSSNRSDSSVQIEVRSLERKLQESERLLAEERSKNSGLESLARDRQDEVGRLVGQLLVVHADYLNLHRQLRRMNATFDDQHHMLGGSGLNHHHAGMQAISLPSYHHLDGGRSLASAPMYLRDSSPDLVVSGSQMLGKIGDRPGSSDSGSGNASSNASGVGVVVGAMSHGGASSGHHVAMGGLSYNSNVGSNLGLGMAMGGGFLSNPLSPTKVNAPSSFDDPNGDANNAALLRRLRGATGTSTGSQRSAESGYSSIA